MSAIQRTHCRDCNEELTVLNSIYQKMSRASRCRLCWNKYQNLHRNKNLKYPETRLKYDFNRRYNITTEEYNKLNEIQKGLCAICNKECSKNKKLSVDHNHDTDKIRGLLCHNCNILIGAAREDIVILINAINYLNTFNK